jgi:hypothetical protein
MNCRKLSLTATLLLLITACTNAPADIEVKTNADSDTDADVVRTIEVTGETQCQLRIQKGRKDPEVYAAKTCRLKRSGDFVTSLSLGFDAPCKQYSFNNLIGDKFFFDAKAVTTPNKACAIESFSASHGWALVQK